MATQTAQADAGGHGFGTLPVFLAGISTILGAIMFLRFGYAVGHAGLLGSILIILIGHLVTIPTALAIAEIATNRKVEGGGEYFIISRSFGTTIGSVIGISLYLSQAVSVAFYMIAFAEAFSPLVPTIEGWLGLSFRPQMISIPATLALLALMLTKGAALGVKALYVVVVTLAASLVLFFLGKPVDGLETEAVSLTAKVADSEGFFIVFAICFPAFTGMTAGVGLSGDLANPRKSIPRGTLAATLVGMVMYLFIVTKLAYSAPVDELANNQLVMADIALWGPMIPIGLACATLSSAIGSILVAPRTLQALGGDHSMPWGEKLNNWLSHGIGAVNEPRNTTLVTGALALFIVILGDVNFVARIISMFFMVTYGALNAISFLENFASRPSYRPSFRSRWYISLFGAVMCLLMMFQMDPLFALLSILLMVGLYIWISRGQTSENDLAAMFQGVLTQATRYMHVKLQRRRQEDSNQDEWRPSVIMVNDRTFDRWAPMALLRWLGYKHGFGTYLHFIKGFLNRDSHEESLEAKERLVKLARTQESRVYVDTIVSPSMTSALAQSLQVPGVSGINNNAVLFEFSTHDPPEVCEEVVQHCLFAASTQMTLLVLRHGDFHFGERKAIHIWLTWNDAENDNLMILLSYILLGHPDWEDAEVQVFAALPSSEVEERLASFKALVSEGRVPISEKNITFLPVDDKKSYQDLVTQKSADADLTIIGFRLGSLEERGASVFHNHPKLREVLFVHAPHEISIE